MQITAKHRKIVSDYRRFKEAQEILYTDKASEAVTLLERLAKDADSDFGFPAARALARLYRHGAHRVAVDRVRSRYWLEQAYEGSWLTRTLGWPDPITAFWCGGRYMFATQVAIAVQKIDEIDKKSP